VQHYLSDEAVEACPPSAAYRIHKFMRRNKAAIATIAIVAAALLAGTAVATWQAVRAINDRNRAVEAERKAVAATEEAEANFQRAVDAVDTMLTEVAEVSLKDVPLMSKVRQSLLERALRFYQDFLDQRSDDPGLRLETARALRRVSDILYLLGRHLEASDYCRQSIAVLKAMDSDRLDAQIYEEEIAKCYGRLGFLLQKMMSRGDSESSGLGHEAVAAFEDAVGYYQELAEENPDEPRYARALGSSYGELGDLYAALFSPVESAL